MNPNIIDEMNEALDFIKEKMPESQFTNCARCASRHRTEDVRKFYSHNPGTIMICCFCVDRCYNCGDLPDTEKSVILTYADAISRAGIRKFCNRCNKKTSGTSHRTNIGPGPHAEWRDL